MSLAALLASVVGVLEAERIPYMVSGSIASAYYGEPRATRDIDLVIDPTAPALDRLVARLQQEGAYVDGDAARTALKDRTQFNAVAGDAKVDFMIRRARPYSKTEFERRSRVQLPGVAAEMVTIEDLILVKLEWAAATDSERQRRDVEGMVRVAGPELDRGYLDEWAGRLGLTERLRRLLDSVAQE